MKINCKNNIPIWNNPNWNIIRLRVNSEAAHTLVNPEIRDVVQGLSHVGIGPVQVGLCGREGVQVVLLAFCVMPLRSPVPFPSESMKLFG